MLLGGETQVDSYNSPTSNGSLNATDENITLNTNDTNTTSLDTPMPPNMIQTSTAQQMTISDDYKNVSKDSNQNFLPENNLELYQPQHTQHISPRVQPYDLNIAHQQAHLHNLRSNNHHYNNNNNNTSVNGRKLSQFKNQNLLVNNPMYDGIVSSSTNNNDMMVLKVEPENGY